MSRRAIETGGKYMREWDIGKHLSDLLNAWTVIATIIYVVEKLT